MKGRTTLPTTMGHRPHDESKILFTHEMANTYGKHQSLPNTIIISCNYPKEYSIKRLQVSVTIILSHLET